MTIYFFKKNPSTSVSSAHGWSILAMLTVSLTCVWHRSLATVWSRMAPHRWEYQLHTFKTLLMILIFMEKIITYNCHNKCNEAQSNLAMLFFMSTNLYLLNARPLLLLITRLVLTNQLLELCRIRLKLLLRNSNQKTVGTFSLLVFLVFYYISSQANLLTSPIKTS